MAFAVLAALPLPGSRLVLVAFLEPGDSAWEGFEHNVAVCIERSEVLWCGLEQRSRYMLSDHLRVCYRSAACAEHSQQAKADRCTYALNQ